MDALQVGLGHMIDVAVLVTGDGDFVPLVRVLNKQGVRVLAAYFAFEKKDGGKSFTNERLLAAANYAVDIDALGSSKEQAGLRDAVQEGASVVGLTARTPTSRYSCT